MGLGLAQAWSAAWPLPCPLAESSLRPAQGVSGRVASPDTSCHRQLSLCHGLCVPVQP